MITTIVLDIGQVLADFRWQGFLDDCGYDEETRSRISKATVLSTVWKEADRGSMTDDELARLSCMIDPEMTNEIYHFYNNIIQFVREYDYSANFIKNLKDNGYRVYLLSNYGRTGFEYAKTHFEFIKYVDGGVISYEVNYVKPEPEIYQALIKKYQINPKEAVFLDDVQENLNGAKQFGFQTILVKSFDQALEELKTIGVKIE